jgi:hypothetical protein
LTNRVRIMRPMPQQIIANELDIIRARESLAGMGSLDAKRPDAWRVFGYRDTLTFADYLTAYERGGPAHGAVHRLLDKCWQEWPRIKRPDSDDESPWETKVQALLRSVDAWRKLRDFDRRNMIGRFAGLIYRVADNLALDQPLVRGSRLVDIVPVYEDQLRVTAWDADPASESFGEPTMWQYRMRKPRSEDNQGRPDAWANVHPSRIQILAEGTAGDFFDGVPLLKAGFNHLVDIEKIAGGSGESYLKNSARTLVFKYGSDAVPETLQHNPDGSTQSVGVREAHEAQTRALNRNTDASIVIQGGDATTLQTTVQDPTGAWTLAANLFAASIRIPFTVLFGQQTGRMASDEDKADFNSRAKSRQTNELTPMLEQLVTRMQAAGLIEPGPFEIEWPPLDAPGDTDKAELIGKMAAAARSAYDTGAGMLFDGNEYRKAMGYEEMAEPVELPPLPDAPEETADTEAP